MKLGEGGQSVTFRLGNLLFLYGTLKLVLPVFLGRIQSFLNRPPFEFPTSLVKNKFPTF